MTIIITKIADKIIKSNRVKNTLQDIHIHSSNCGCHGSFKSNSVMNQTFSSFSSLTTEKNEQQQQQQLFKQFSNSKPIPMGRKVELDTSKVIDSVYFGNTENNNYRTNKGNTDYAFEASANNIRFGSGVTYEVGYDLLDMNCRNVIVFTDNNLLKLVDTDKESAVAKCLYSLEKCGIKYTIYSDVSIEPTDTSFKDAISVMGKGRYDGVVAVGGGSVMDTAKAANLYNSYPPADNDFLAYINPPIGKGLLVPGPLKRPLIAIPTTCGTASETTGVCILDIKLGDGLSAKTGIASRHLKPILGLVDPDNLLTLPSNVAISSGFDQLCHALESFTAIPFNQRSPRPLAPNQRPSYQGANPVSDVWSLRSLEMLCKNIHRFVLDPNDDYARSQMMLAASYAGLGFGNSGVHACHGMSYSISSMVKDYKPEGYYGLKKNLIPHGQSVILSAPAVFKFTAPSNPERHLLLAKIMGADISNASESDAGILLSNQIVKLMKLLNVPNGLQALGYKESDIDSLVKGTLPQHRVTKLMPKQATYDDLYKLFKEIGRAHV